MDIAKNRVEGKLISFRPLQENRRLLMGRSLLGSGFFGSQVIGVNRRIGVEWSAPSEAVIAIARSRAADLGQQVRFRRFLRVGNYEIKTRVPELSNMTVSRNINLPRPVTLPPTFITARALPKATRRPITFCRISSLSLCSGKKLGERLVEPSDRCRHPRCGELLLSARRTCFRRQGGPVKKWTLRLLIARKTAAVINTTHYALRLKSTVHFPSHQPTQS